VPLGQRQKKFRIPCDRRIGGDFHLAKLPPELHHRIQHHQPAAVVEQHAHRGVEDVLAGGAPALGRGIQHEDRVVSRQVPAGRDQVLGHGGLGKHLFCPGPPAGMENEPQEQP
jgi:hypothetical protein